jgi:stage V sporulation protein K
VDEAYTLNTEYSYGKEAVATLTNMMTEYKGRCCVILAGYEDRMNRMMRETNPGLRERFPFRLVFDDYSAGELMEIFMNKLEGAKLRISNEGRQIVNETIEKLVEERNEEFSNARVAENIFQEIVLQQERRLYQAHTSKTVLTARTLFSITKADCESASKKVISLNHKPLKIVQPIGFTIAG